MKSKIFYIVVIIQTIVIFVLLSNIIFKYKNYFHISVSPIPASDIQKSQSGGLKYFYEPKTKGIKKIYNDLIPQKIVYSINKDSLNERYDYEVKKEEGVFRIVTLGDSYTFGESVSTKDNYPEQLENLLNTKCKNSKFEVINLGVYGYDIQYMNERYLKRGAKYNPDLVIMLFGSFQLFRLSEDLEIRLRILTETSPELDYLSRYARASQEIILDRGWKSILDWQSKQIDQITDSIKAKKIIMKFPPGCKNKYRWYSQVFECWPFIEYDNLFKKVSIEKQNIFLINIPDIKKDLYSPGGHPNIKGYGLIANTAFKHLTDNKLIPCEQ